MQGRTTVITGDIFLAAYILSLCDCDVAIQSNEKKQIIFEIRGKGVIEFKRVYSEDLAFIVLLGFKEAFYDLLNQSGQSIRPKAENT